jgi:pimeloyl-ACP methyl ester carboxylesterase
MRVPLRRVFLFSGMGGYARLLAPIHLAGIEVVAPNHAEPLPDEDLPRYAARVAGIQGIGSEDVVGGASFGGMLAAEISGQRRVAGLILLGSCLKPTRLPWTYRWVERVGRFVPDFALSFRSFRPLVRWRFAPISRAAEECLVAMAAVCPTNQIRAFGRMILSWKGAEKLSCPVLSIHGATDRIIPPSAAEPGIVFKDAGHAFTLTHPTQTISAIEDFLTRL